MVSNFIDLHPYRCDLYLNFILYLCKNILGICVQQFSKNNFFLSKNNLYKQNTSIEVLTNEI